MTYTVMMFAGAIGSQATVDLVVPSSSQTLVVRDLLFTNSGTVPTQFILYVQDPVRFAWVWAHNALPTFQTVHLDVRIALRGPMKLIGTNSASNVYLTASGYHFDDT